MGRRVRRGGEFTEWRAGFRARMVDRFDQEFAAEAMELLEADSAAFGERLDDSGFLEAIVPAQVLARRRGRAHG